MNRLVRIDYRFPYAENCSVEQVGRMLDALSKGWHGWARFPWRVTRHLQKYLEDPPINFHYLMVHECLAGFAAHLVLTADFVNRAAVLGRMVAVRFEIVGALRMLLINALRVELRRTGLPYILDASGPEDGHRHLSAEEIERRRADFRACVQGAVDEFVQILNVASFTKNLNCVIAGHPLWYWAAGGVLPEVVGLEVQVEESVGGMTLRPSMEEMWRIVMAKRPPPALVVTEGSGMLMARLVPLGGEAAGEGWAEGAGAEPRGPGGKLVRWEPTTKHAKGTKGDGVGLAQGAGAEPRGPGVQVAWAGAAAGAAAFTGPGAGGVKPGAWAAVPAAWAMGPMWMAGGDMKVRELKEHLDGRFDRLGREYAEVREENERLKGELATVLANLARKVEPEFFQWVFVILGAGSVAAAARQLGLPNATFTARLKGYTKRGGLYATLYETVKIRTKGVGKRSMVGFNELLAAHQKRVQSEPRGGDEALLLELLNGLEEMGRGNWQGMRNELIEMVREAIL